MLRVYSELLMALIAVGTLVGGALWAGQDAALLDDSSGGRGGGSESSSAGLATQEISAGLAGVMFVMASVVLLMLYFLINYITLIMVCPPSSHTRAALLISLILYTFFQPVYVSSNTFQYIVGVHIHIIYCLRGSSTISIRLDQQVLSVYLHWMRVRWTENVFTVYCQCCRARRHWAILHGYGSAQAMLHL